MGITIPCREKPEYTDEVVRIAKWIGIAALSLLIQGCKEPPNETILQTLQSIASNTNDSCEDACANPAQIDLCMDVCTNQPTSLAEDSEQVVIGE
ncbi:MAG: hypothetical protein WC604_04165 [Candidatus Gracilibacteria bacterium]